MKDALKPKEMLAEAGNKSTVQEGIGTVITVVSVHLTTPFIIALAVIVAVPGATPVTVVL